MASGYSTPGVGRRRVPGRPAVRPPATLAAVERAAPRRRPFPGIREPARIVSRVLVVALPIAAFVAAGAATLLRQTGVPKVRTIWAEDGTVFLACAYDAAGPGACLLEPYNGWIHLVPRLGAEVAAAVAPADASLALAVVAAIVAGLAAAVLAVAIRNATGSWAAGFVGGASLALVWQAGREVGGNVTNLPWVLLAAGIGTVVASFAGHRVRAPDLVLLAGAGLSTAFAPILAALALVGLGLRRPRAGRVVAVTAAAALIQVVVIVLTPRRAPGQAPLGAEQAVATFAREIVARGPFGPTDWGLGALAALGIVVVGLVSLLLAVRAGRAGAGEPGSARPDEARTALLVIAILVGTAALTYLTAIVLQRTFNPRYGYVPSVLLCLALVVGAALVRRLPVDATERGGRAVRALARWALPAVLVLLAVGFGRSFRLESRPSAGPDYVAGYQAAVAACDAAAESITIRIPPIGDDVWTIEIPCDRVPAAE